MKVISICAAGAVLAIFAIATTPAMAQCVAVRTAAQLQAISSGNLTRNYCLKNDIDLSSIANFTPIGTTTPFTGSFDGGGFVIRNFKTDRTNLDQVGLFGLTNGATIQNVTLEGVQVVNRKNSTTTGVLVGTTLSTTQILNVKVKSGELAYLGTGGSAGGLVGFAMGDTIIENSSSMANVGAMGDNAGGLAGTIDTNSTISRSYATGIVFCSGATCHGGGLVGVAAGLGVSITRSFATGNVVCSAFCGGLVGDGDGQFSQVYASGQILGDSSATKGGLFGRLRNSSATTLDQSFSVGLVGGGTLQFGGLIGVTSGNPGVTFSYWDKQTSGLNVSAAGNGRTTAQLRNALPTGFLTSSWGITRPDSYPYLKTGTPDFDPQLAALVAESLPFTFVPISQLDKFNYNGATNNIDEASLATCYTMVARAIGAVTNDGRLEDVKTDRYFWRDNTQKTFWLGPVTGYATLGTLTPIGANTPLTNNVIKELKANKLVLLRGTYRSGAQNVESWMLGTLYTTNAGGTATAVVANDPFTGKQVTIDPATKRVLSPSGFPLTNFKVNGYQTVTIDIFH